MTTRTLKVPEKHAVWLREHCLGELAADMDSFPATEIDPEDIAIGRRQFGNAGRLLECVGFTGRTEGEVSVDLNSDYLRPLLQSAVESLGERMKEATGQYETTKLDLDEVARVAERAIWLVETLDELFPGWPENGGDERLSPWVDVRDDEKAVA